MDFFSKLGNMASETYKKTSKKTGDLAKEAKIRMKMNEDKAHVKDLYEAQDSLLDYKSSPIDHGEQIWDYLYENRYAIDSKESLEELYILKENGERY